jgi:hypothetical protein
MKYFFKKTYFAAETTKYEAKNYFPIFLEAFE